MCWSFQFIYPTQTRVWWWMTSPPPPLTMLHLSPSNISRSGRIWLSLPPTPATDHGYLLAPLLQGFSSRSPSMHSETPTWSRTRRSICCSINQRSHDPPLLMDLHWLPESDPVPDAAYRETSGSAAAVWTQSYRLMLLLDLCVPLRNLVWFWG